MRPLFAPIPRRRRIRPRLVRRTLFTALLLAGVVAAACGSDDAPRGAVHLATVDGGIGPVTAAFIDRALDRAEESGATAFVLLLDTPGGLISATDDIVQRFEAAQVPVVVYVSPLGARAASAGTFITMAAHLAAMAPSTQIGAASPVGGGGEDIEGDLREKVFNDASADIRGIAELRGRNADWAERAVREAISATAQEALDLNVIDIVANDLDDLLAQIDGREVALSPGGPRVTVRSAGAPRVQTDMSFFERVRNFVADPNIAFLLIQIGGLALIIELFSPGLLGPGIFGVMAILLGFYGLGALDASPVGIGLLVLGFLLILTEIFVAGFGVFGIGGIVALILGGVLLIEDAPDAEKVSLWALAGAGAMLAAAVLLISLAVFDAKRRRIRRPSLTQRMVGKEGITRSALEPDGTVLAESELWSARAEGEPIPTDARVLVVAVDGLSLVVEQLEAPGGGAAVPPAGAASQTGASG